MTINSITSRTIGVWLLVAAAPGCLADVEETTPEPQAEHQAPELAQPNHPSPTAVTPLRTEECVDSATRLRGWSGAGQLHLRRCDVEGAICCGGELCTAFEDELYCLHSL